MAASRLKVEDWADPVWRLHNLYWIVDERGKRVRFVPNDEQRHFLEHYWYLNIILKARQLGFTTLIDLMLLDQCVFVPNISSSIIAHGLEQAGKIFRDKVQFPWKNLPGQIHQANPLVKDTVGEFAFKNNSSISVTTSTRSGTVQYLHVSEFGKICRKFPERATEIVTGALNTVHAGQFVFIESTAEGRGGPFYDMTVKAKALLHAGKTLSEMDYRLHFYPWYTKQSYRLDAQVVITADFDEYFDELETEHGIVLDQEQKAWYFKKATSSETQREHMQREYPSTVDEAFKAANDEKYWAAAIERIREAGHIKDVPHNPRHGVNMFLDIGRDTTAIWFHQRILGEDRFIDYYQTAGRTLSDMAPDLQRKPYRIEKIYLPHDGEDQSIVTYETAQSVMEDMYRNADVKTLERVRHKQTAIDKARDVLPNCWFDERKCAVGLAGLEGYRKKWNEEYGTWSNEPVHDAASHPASAFEQFAMGFEEGGDDDFEADQDTNWRTA